MYDTKVINLFEHFEEGIEAAVKLIKAGDVVAFPTETVYGLGADCLRQEAVKMIFAAKGRPSDNPLIAHVHCIDQAVEIAHVTSEAEALMEAFWPGPLTIVMKKRANVPHAVCAGLPTVAVRMPDDRAALELIKRSGGPIAAPSANVSGSPSPTCAKHVLDDLAGRIPMILDGGDCEVGLESTVVMLAENGEPPRILRPGAITPEMLCVVVGQVALSSGVLHKVNEQALSPGMKYKHYAPRAEVLLVADGPGQAETVCELYEENLALGKKCVIFATIQSKAFYNSKNCVIMGNKYDAAAACSALFGALRSADEESIDCIIIEALPASGMGLAYMNRVLRAAGFAVIK